MLLLYFPIYLYAVAVSLAIDLLCKFFLNWFVAATADHNGNLPRRLSWFQTFDATLDEGMLARRRELAEGLGGDTWSSFNPDPANWFERYWNRALWLFRNSGYGFDYYLLGQHWNPANWQVLRYTDTDQLTLFVAVGDGFNVYYHGRFGMAKLGWKAWNLFEGSTGRFRESWGNGGMIPICFSISPFKRKG